MGDEPVRLTITTEEAQRRYDAAVTELGRICEGPRDKFRMRIPAQRDDSDFILSDALFALKQLIDREVVERDVKAELVETLEALVGYTKACEGLLNASPAEQVRRAEAVLARVRGGQG